MSGRITSRHLTSNSSVAVVGGGAAGLGAARELVKAGLDVTLIESAPLLGGNCVGLPVRGADGTVHTVDVGVSDFNRVTFGEVTALIDELGLETHPINNDAHFVSPEGASLWACQSGRWIFRERVSGGESVADELADFRTRALEVLHDERFASWTVARYLEHIGASAAFRAVAILPRAMGCFPMPDCSPSLYSIRSLVRFWNLHGIVSDRVADRRRVVGGMHRYVRAFESWLADAGGTLRCGTRVRGVRRDRRGVTLHLEDAAHRHELLRVGQVIFANHAHEALGLLVDPSAGERAVLPRFATQRARVVVHQDERLMGSDRELWGAFHYVVPRGGLPKVRPTITFHPNLLGSLPADVPPVFVSMNPHVEPRPDRVLATRQFLHPIGCTANEVACSQIAALQGRRRTWFAGSYLSSPYVHESALSSGIAAARGLLARESCSLAWPKVRWA